MITYFSLDISSKTVSNMCKGETVLKHVYRLFCGFLKQK